MLKNYNDNHFLNKGINNKAVIFFLQRCLEIFEPRTLDTYQYSIWNVVVGMREYLEVIEKTLDGSFLTMDNVDACRLELLRVINDDDIIEKYMGGLCGRIKSHLGNVIKKDEKSKLLRAKCEMSYSLKLIEPKYQEWLMKELFDNIKNGDLQKVHIYIRVLASLCIYNGWTPYGVSTLINRIFLLSDNVDFESNWSKFTDELGKDQEFTIYINLKLNAKGANTSDIEVIELIKKLGISILGYNEILDKHNTIEKKKLPVKNEKKYMIFTAKAKDVKAAALEAVNNLNSKITILAFYNKINSWSLKDLDGFVIMEESSYIWSFKIEDLYKTYLFLDSSNKVFENAMEVYSKSNENLKLTNNAFKGVFNYTNISLLSVYPEEKFMNLWIALESFMRTGQYSNIISHIKEVLPPIVCKRYIYKIVRNFGEDCIRCKVELNLTNGAIDLNNDYKQEMVRELIRAIRDDETFNEIKQLCAVNSLLIYRLGELKDILKDNLSVVLKIKKYYETISWHIQRLYRVRNEIAHSALKESKYLVSYIEHLYDYLAILITEIVFICSEKKIESIDEIFPSLKDNYDAFESILQGKKVTMKEFQLEDGIIDYL
ncbi:hypothetical protein [Clostridium sp. UBA1652]|uniref:hypothetical protein n=1 Tax=Clostridium sp. UBA1652 TaxID=1946348 RepID=UPI00257B78FD|nr:hypothetical protein [Clostridium sp. UBA1652]